MRDCILCAVVGAPNKGKSTFISTMVGSTKVEIKYEKGTTREAKLYSYLLNNEKILGLYDTPGFENQSRMLSELKNIKKDNKQSSSEFSAYDGFYKKYENNHEDGFELETKILKAVSHAEVIIYMVMGTEPVTKAFMQDIEILKFAEKPIIVILNKARDDDKGATDAQEKYLEDWKSKVKNEGLPVHNFDPHNATLYDKLNVLDLLKSMEQDWTEPIEAIKKDILRKICMNISLTSKSITDYMETSLSYQKGKKLKRGENIEDKLNELEREYKHGINNFEQKCFNKIREIWQHENYNIKYEEGILNFVGVEKLFNTKQTIMKRSVDGAGIGASMGIVVDVATLGATLGVGLIIGSMVGGAMGIGAGWIESNNIKNTKTIKWWAKKFVIGGKKSIPGLDNELLQRILLFTKEIASRPHGNRTEIRFNNNDEINDEIEELKTLHKNFVKGNVSGKDEEEYKKIINEQLLDYFDNEELSQIYTTEYLK